MAAQGVRGHPGVGERFGGGAPGGATAKGAHPKIRVGPIRVGSREIRRFSGRGSGRGGGGSAQGGGMGAGATGGAGAGALLPTGASTAQRAAHGATKPCLADSSSQTRPRISRMAAQGVRGHPGVGERFGGGAPGGATTKKTHPKIRAANTKPGSGVTKRVGPQD